MKKIFFLLVISCFQIMQAQSSFPYDVVLTPVTVTGLPGLHSYAFAQHNGKWLIIGGRKDGLHARQPFNAFPSSQNNTDIYVVDVVNNQLWSASLNALPTAIKEQLQSTNMNFYQDEDTLYIIGGYCFSATANDHITHNKLTAIDVVGLMTAIETNATITPFFKQITNDVFAITGGQLGKIGNEFYLVGGHRFDGRYNPMNNPTFTQTYSSAIRKFQIDNSGTQLSFSNYSVTTDAVHLHRRDYNLVPQVFPNGELGYTISSGVFQIGANLPFLYPVDIKANGYFPQTQFSQYLSNYHSGKVGLYNATDNQMHSLFFGGMSQYYYQNGTLIQDNTVPFVKTISRVSRLSNGSLEEYQLPVEMPNLKGSGAEFIPNKNIPHYTNEVIQLHNITAPEFVIGHLYGGILSTSPTAFTDNQTNLTSADSSIYEVKLVYNSTLHLESINGKNPFNCVFYPNPVTNDTVMLNLDIPYEASLEYYVMSVEGKIISEGIISNLKEGKNTMEFNLESPNEKMVIVTFIFDNKFYKSEKILKKQ
ncbi:hypothetical protein [Flavobacterium sp.]|uniref:hypothetical protein n=1 Tax=Flavobacterium sp. TaxID=239 RepID=UPI003527C1BB